MTEKLHLRTDSRCIGDAIDLAYDALHDIAVLAEDERLHGPSAAEYTHKIEVAREKFDATAERSATRGTSPA